MTPRRFTLWVARFAKGAVCCLCSLSLVWAQAEFQSLPIAPTRPSGAVLIRPYRAPEVPPIQLNNSSRLASLIRANHLYLTVQDAIALALENNVDLEVARYNPIISQWNLERSEAGGALPGVPSNAAQAGAVASGQGVLGSQAAAGVAGGGAAGNAQNQNNATITQVGPVTENLDPAVQEASTFSHQSTPQANTTQSITQVLEANTRVHSASLQQGFITGGGVTVNFSDHYLKENSPTDVLNPSVAPSLSLQFQHNLLRGFGVAVNARTIRVSRVNLQTSVLAFRTQVINTVVNVLRAYYTLVSDIEDVRAKTSAFETAQQFLQNSQRQLTLGTLSPLDVTTAQTQVASARANLVVSQTNLRQQEVRLKDMLSRRGLLDPVLAPVDIVPLDRIEIPAADDLAPLPQLVQEALGRRSDIAQARAGITTAEISSVGTRNGILPSLQAFGNLSAAGLAGTRTGPADPYFVGGTGTALGQVFRRNFPTNSIGAFFQAPVHNGQAQSDYGIDQLQLRQTQLSTQKTINQVTVDISNDLIGMRQARAQYQAATQNRILEQQLYDAEQRKFTLGASTPYNVIQQQRDLIAAQASEVVAENAYIDARIALDQALGTTLEANHVSIDEARTGQVARTSSLPSSLPPAQSPLAPGRP